jgi:putative DNA primase/helicase
MVARLSVEDAVARYCGTYGFGGDVLFDLQERRLVHKKDVMNLLPRHGWDAVREHPAWQVVRDHEVGFDPTESDPAIKCNLFGGWPTVPAEGSCERLLELLNYLCSNEPNGPEIYQWMLHWLAYPLQHRGAKMHSAIVIHGPQGTGKSRFFEAYAKIFGPYGRVLGQEALEDKFNSDWAEKKLFVIGDEVLARADMYHIKNRLKGFITGGTIRVNPKNLAAHNEKNQMNIVFLSNERMPLVLENDDRRHCVIWVPPKLGEDFFDEVNDEIDKGGVAALHHYLLNMDLGNFKPWTKPPMTNAKADLIELGKSSEERFVQEWLNLEIESATGEPLPLCPCLGSHLFKAYCLWCERQGERRRGMKDLIGLIGKMPGWRAGKSVPTWTDLQNPQNKNRKMIIPASGALSGSLTKNPRQQDFLLEKFSSQAEWLTAGFFAFAECVGES